MELMQYTAIFKALKSDMFETKICVVFLIFFSEQKVCVISKQVILTSTHNLCFKAEIKNVYSPFYYIKERFEFT